MSIGCKTYNMFKKLAKPLFCITVEKLRKTAIGITNNVQPIRKLNEINYLFKNMLLQS